MVVRHQGEEVRLPDFMVVGAAKCGTSTVYQYLNQHPEVFFPKGKKEPHYFSFGGQVPTYTDAQFVGTMTWQTEAYLNLYQPAPEHRLLGDGSTSYLYRAQEAIAHMKQLYGAEKAAKIRIIILLRHPVERAFSHYNYLVRNGFENLPFSEAVKPKTMARRKALRWGYDYLGYSDYLEGVKAYLEHFELVKVIEFEQLKNATNLGQSLCQFLDLSNQQVSAMPKTNPSGRPKSRALANLMLKNGVLKKAVNWLPDSTKQKVLVARDKALSKVLVKDTLSESLRQELLHHFQDSTSQLEDLLQVSLSEWRK